jgi:hypothetical protein
LAKFLSLALSAVFAADPALRGSAKWMLGIAALLDKRFVSF